MNIFVNGSIENIDEMTVLEFIIFRGLSPDKLVIEHNENILKKEYWESTMLKSDDTLEIISFVGGG